MMKHPTRSLHWPFKETIEDYGNLSYPTLRRPRRYTLPFEERMTAPEHDLHFLTYPEGMQEIGEKVYGQNILIETIPA